MMNFIKLSVYTINSEYLFSTTWNYCVLSLVYQAEALSVAPSVMENLHSHCFLVPVSLSIFSLHAEVILITKSTMQRSLD